MSARRRPASEMGDRGGIPGALRGGGRRAAATAAQGHAVRDVPRIARYLDGAGCAEPCGTAAGLSRGPAEGIPQRDARAPGNERGGQGAQRRGHRATVGVVRVDRDRGPRVALRTGLAAALLAALAPGARAQEAVSPVILEPVVVSATRTEQRVFD